MASLSSRDCVFGNQPKANAYVAGWPLPNGVTVKSPSPSFITPRITAFSPLLHKQCIHVSILRSHLHVLYLPLLLWDPPYCRSEEPPLKLRPLMKGLESLRWDYSVACKFLWTLVAVVASLSSCYRLWQLAFVALSSAIKFVCVVHRHSMF